MMTSTAVQTVEIMRLAGLSDRAQTFCNALAQAAPSCDLVPTWTDQYRGGSDLLVLWGPGAPDRFEPMRRQVAAGGHALALDLPYWDRFNKIRVSVDAAHPQEWVMRKDLLSTRFVADRVKVANVWNADGPVIVAGIGTKARVQYGAHVVDAWERDMIARWLAAGKNVLYRRKRGIGAVPAGAKDAGDAPIEQVLSGASLVITYHSNVAVDAIRMGIPVICRDGAAAAVCPSTWPGFEAPQPLQPDVRDRFLSNLAWFQWRPDEALACWSFLKELLS